MRDEIRAALDDPRVTQDQIVTVAGADKLADQLAAVLNGQGYVLVQRSKVVVPRMLPEGSGAQFREHLAELGYSGEPR